jgi:hypothetical protein
MLEETGFARDKIKRLEPMHAVAKGGAIVGAQLDEQFKVRQGRNFHSKTI